jgi:hypothetical protein
MLQHPASSATGRRQAANEKLNSVKAMAIQRQSLCDQIEHRSMQLPLVSLSVALRSSIVFQPYQRVPRAEDHRLSSPPPPLNPILLLHSSPSSFFKLWKRSVRATLTKPSPKPRRTKYTVIHHCGVCCIHPLQCPQPHLPVQGHILGHRGSRTFSFICVVLDIRRTWRRSPT